MEFIEEDSEYSDESQVSQTRAGVVISTQTVITNDDLEFNLSKKTMKKSKRKVGVEEVQRAIENDRFVTLVVKRENSERRRIRKKSAPENVIPEKKSREQSIPEDGKAAITTQEVPQTVQKAVHFDAMPSLTPEPQLHAKARVVSFSQSPILTHIPLAVSKFPPVRNKPRTHQNLVSQQSIFSTVEGLSSSPESDFTVRTTHNQGMRPQENASKSLSNSTSHSPKRRIIFPSTVNPILRHLGAGTVDSPREDRDEYYTEPAMALSTDLRRRVVKASNTITEELSVQTHPTHLSKKYVAAHIVYDRDFVSKGFSPFRCSKRDIFHLRISPVPPRQKKSHQESILKETFVQEGQRKGLKLPIYGL